MIEDVRIPEPVHEACRQLMELRMTIASNADIRRSRRRVQDTHRLAQDASNDLERLMSEYQPKIEEMEKYIIAHALEVGQTFESSGVNVKFVSGHDRLSISKKSLDDIEKNDPDLWSSLQKFIEKKTIEPRVTVISD